MRRKSILIGNGFNRCSDDAPAWDELVERVAQSVGVKSLSDVPMPIEFERIGSNASQKLGYNRSGGKDSFLELKKEVKRLIEAMNCEPLDLHRRLWSLHPDAIITTNYDTVIEAAYENEIDFEAVNHNSKYLLEPTSVARSGTKIFHAHGQTNPAKSICMGYDHYMGYVERMRSRFFKSNEDTDPIVRKIISQGEPESWPEWFLLSDVSIIGLGLDYQEIDLWWLLAVRSSIFNSSRQLNELANKITYYYYREPNDDADSLKNFETTRRNKRGDLLDGLGVRVIPIDARSYCESYEKALDRIREDWGRTD